MSTLVTIFLILLAAGSIFWPQGVLVLVLLLFADSLLAAIVAALAAWLLPWTPPRTVAQRASIVTHNLYTPVMSIDDALQVLGVPRGATQREITAAYRATMRRVHPDKGGSPRLASIVNEAYEKLAV